MMNMDTSKMSDEAWNVGGQNDPQMMSFPTLVEEIYEKPNLTQRAIEEEWWEGIVDNPNTVAELKEALQNALSERHRTWRITAAHRRTKTPG